MWLTKYAHWLSALLLGTQIAKLKLPITFNLNKVFVPHAEKRKTGVVSTCIYQPQNAHAAQVNKYKQMKSVIITWQPSMRAIDLQLIIMRTIWYLLFKASTFEIFKLLKTIFCLRFFLLRYQFKTCPGKISKLQASYF